MNLWALSRLGALPFRSLSLVDGESLVQSHSGRRKVLGCVKMQRRYFLLLFHSILCAKYVVAQHRKAQFSAQVAFSIC